MRAMTVVVFLLLSSLGCKQPAQPQAAPAPTPRRYGPIMVSVAHHYEMLGRAIAAERWELAAFALRELDEDLDELPLAEQPEEARAPLADIARDFSRSQLVTLTQAVEARSVTSARAAYAGVSTACNGCHQTAGFAFIVVPSEVGSAVPEIAPAVEAPRIAVDASSAEDATAPDVTVPRDATVRRLPALWGACDDRIGCARGLMCCTHGGIAMPATHRGRCMTYHMCQTQPVAAPGR